MQGHEIVKTLVVFETYPQRNDTRPTSDTDHLKKCQRLKKWNNQVKPLALVNIMKLDFINLVKDIVHCSILLRCLMALYISVVKNSISKMLLTL
jgi:hypothetical protein